MMIDIDIDIDIDLDAWNHTRCGSLIWSMEPNQVHVKRLLSTHPHKGYQKMNSRLQI